MVTVLATGPPARVRAPDHPGRILPAVVAAMLTRIAELETQLAGRLPPDWVAVYGPVYDHMKTGMLDVHAAWQEVQSCLRSRRAEFPELAGKLELLASVVVKLAVDTHLAAARRPVLPDDTAAA